MRPLRHDLSSEYVHVTQRGLGRRLIFEDDTDRRFFLKTLKEKSTDSYVFILAWCLMENHVHLLVKARQADLSKMMQRLGTSYAQYFNGRHGHVGKVFQNRFSSQAVEADAHLLTAIRYIHRNAEDAGTTAPQDYPWSSYREIIGENVDVEGLGLCDVATTIGLFGSIEEFKRFHEVEDEWDGFARIDTYRPRLSDDDAREIAIKHYGVNFSDHLASLPKKERDDALRLLKDLGISIRQLERLTGIGRGPIAKA